MEDQKYTQTTINGYKIDHEHYSAGGEYLFSQGKISKGKFKACLSDFMEGRPLKNKNGIDQLVPHAETRKRIERWVYARGW
jgi:hypothetical protein